MAKLKAAELELKAAATAAAKLKAKEAAAAKAARTGKVRVVYNHYNDEFDVDDGVLKWEDVDNSVVSEPDKQQPPLLQVQPPPHRTLQTV